MNKKYTIFLIIVIAILLTGIFCLPKIFELEKQFKKSKLDYSGNYSGKKIILAAEQNVTSAESSLFRLNGTNFKTELNALGGSGALKYTDSSGQYISFKPLGIRTNLSETLIKTPSTTSKFINNKYSEVFNDDTELKIESSKNNWTKILKFNSTITDELASIDYVEIEYEIETNFIINGWGKETDFEITEPIRLGDNSYLELAYVWNHPANKVQIKSFFKNKNGTLVYIKQIPVSWLNTTSYPFYTDASVRYGTASIFLDRETKEIKSAKLDDEKVVNCFADGGSSDDGQCRVGIIEYASITWGATSTFSTGDLDNFSAPLDVCQLDTDKFLVVYTDADQANDGFARVASTTGSTINGWGTEVEILNSDMEHATCAQLDTDKFVVCFNDESDSDTGKCIAGTVSGETITLYGDGAQAIDGLGGVTDYYPTWSSTDKLDTDKFIYCFMEDETSDDGQCVAGTTATSTFITFGTIAEFSGNDDINYASVTSPDTDKFVVSYTNTTDLNCESVAATVSGTTITFGTPVILKSGTFNGRVQSESIDTTHFVAVYSDANASNVGKSIYGLVDFSDRSITFEDPDTFESGTTGGGTDNGIDITLIGSNPDRVAISFQDDDDSDQGKTIIGEILPVVAFTSSIQESGGDYSTLNSWESTIQCDLTASTTRAYSGTGTGELSGNDVLTLYRASVAQNVTSTLIATTSDQILVDGLTGTTTYAVQSGDEWKKDASNYFTVSGSGNDLGATAYVVGEIDGSWTSADTTAVTISGWTTDATHYIKVYTTDTARHNGIYVGESGAKADTYRIELSNGANNVISIQENYVRIEGLQIKNGDTNNHRRGILTTNATIDSNNDIRISYNIIKGELSGSPLGGRGIELLDSDTNAKVWNNILYGWTIQAEAISISINTAYVYNNTIHNSNKGIYRSGGTVVAKNNLVASTTTEFSGTFSNDSTNNASNGGTTASSTADLTYQTFTFVASSTYDFHLDSGDSGAQDLGADLSGDSNLEITDDIDGDSRSDPFDIGADEVVAVAVADPEGALEIKDGVLEIKDGVLKIKQ